MNCKQGDIAITVATNDSPTSLRNSGRIVEVLRFVGPYRYAQGTVGVNTWQVRLLGSPMSAASGRTYRGEVYIDDANLRPIRPGDIDADAVRDLYAPSPEVKAVREEVA